MDDWARIDAVLQRGHGIASGRAPDSPYPRGSIAMQAPHFRRLGLDLSPYRLATLNLSVAPRRLRWIEPQYRFRNLRWAEGFAAEDFRLCRCRLARDGRDYDGLIYDPDPATKLGHFQPPATVEVIAEPIDDLVTGVTLVLYYDPARLRFESA